MVIYLEIYMQKLAAQNCTKSSKGKFINPPNIYLFKVNDRNTRKRCKICSKFKEQHQAISLQRLEAFLVFLLLTLNLFNTFFWCFYCWLCISKCSLGSYNWYPTFYCCQRLMWFVMLLLVATIFCYFLIFFSFTSFSFLSQVQIR